MSTNTSTTIDIKALSKESKGIIWDYIKSQLPGLDSFVEKAIKENTQVNIDELIPDVKIRITTLFKAYQIDTSAFTDDDFAQKIVDTFDAKIVEPCIVDWQVVIEAVAKECQKLKKLPTPLSSR